MVEVTFNVDELTIGGFRIGATADETTFVNFSNLCCHVSLRKDVEFAAYYRVLDRGTQPFDIDRLVPVPIGVAVEEEQSQRFEVDCYKPAKIAL